MSDADLAGKLFADKEPTKQVMIKMLMPFASFRMNQSSRLGADLGTLMSNVSTVEDKKIAARSLAGFGVEMATFRMISVGTATLIGAFVKEVLGREDDEEKDKKKSDAIIKGQLTSTVADLFSPLPLTDKLIQTGVAGALEKTQDAMEVPDEDRISVYSGTKQDFVQSLGLFGIAADRAIQLYDMANLSSGGAFKDDYGRKKYLSEPDREVLELLIGPALLTNIGLAPSEVNSVIRSAINDAKRNSSTKEGGKSAEDLQGDKKAAEATEGRKENLQQSREEKVEILTDMLQYETDAEKKAAIEKLITKNSATDEERKALKEQNRAKKEKEAELLGGYDNKSDLKRYDPELYEKNFGENSEYYRENRGEMEVEKELNDRLQELEDEKQGYSPAKKRKKARSSSRSYSYRRSSESSR